MIVRPWAHFWSTLPDDTIEDDKDIIQFGGKGVAEAVAGLLRGLGCSVEGPEYAGDHGWDFEVTKSGRRFFGQVTEIEGYWLVLANMSWSDRFFGRQPPVYLDLLRGLARELAADSRFVTVRWYTQEEWGNEERPGASDPIEDPPKRGRRDRKR